MFLFIPVRIGRGEGVTAAGADLLCKRLDWRDRELNGCCWVKGCSLQRQELLWNLVMFPLTLKPPMGSQASQYFTVDSKCWVILMPDKGFTGLAW